MSLKVTAYTGDGPFQEIMKTAPKEQFNARIRTELRQCAEKLSDACNFTNEELVEAAFAALIGTRDNVIEAKRVMAQNKAKELRLSFERAGGRPASIERLVAA